MVADDGEWLVLKIVVETFYSEDPRCSLLFDGGVLYFGFVKVSAGVSDGLVLLIVLLG